MAAAGGGPGGVAGPPVTPPLAAGRGWPMSSATPQWPPALLPPAGLLEGRRRIPVGRQAGLRLCRPARGPPPASAAEGGRSAAAGDRKITAGCRSARRGSAAAAAGRANSRIRCSWWCSPPAGVTLPPAALLLAAIPPAATAEQRAASARGTPTEWFTC